MATMKTIKVQARGLDGYLIECRAGNHIVLVDQANDDGGKDKAPTPLDYLLVSFGSCLVTIGKIVAFQQHINLRGLEVELEGSLNLEVLRGLVKNERSGFHGLRVNMTIDANLSDEQKKEFAEEIERRCPVTDNLLNATSIEFAVN